MYELKINPAIEVSIMKLWNRKEGIKNALSLLSDNPHSRKKECGVVKTYGEFYVSAGNSNAFTFNINEEDKTIEILGFYSKNKLHKMIKRDVFKQPTAIEGTKETLVSEKEISASASNQF